MAGGYVVNRDREVDAYVERYREAKKTERKSSMCDPQEKRPRYDKPGSMYRSNVFRSTVDD